MVEAGLFEVPSLPGLTFISDAVVPLSQDNLEVTGAAAEILRQSVLARVEPARLKEAKALHKASMRAASSMAGKRAHELLTTALDSYMANRVRHDVSSESEISRIRNGCSLLIELGGDRRLAEVDSDRLRHFRDKHLAHVPANENKIRLQHGTTSVVTSIAKVAGIGWPVMSVAERDKRMKWISAWFRWLKAQSRIADDPAAALAGESVVSKVVSRMEKKKVREDEDRDTFTTADLATIFGAPWFKAGRGTLTKKETYREFLPFYYWLPLLGLYTGGGRINEICQLHLADIGQTESGQWFVDFNEDAPDKKLKNTPSKRIVPLHPALLELGLDEWLKAMRAAEHNRLFPELKLDKEKGYGKAATKWFTSYMKRLGIPRDGTKAFHSFRHTYANALPADIPDRIANQMTGHSRGATTRSRRYMKDVEPEEAAKYVNRMSALLPTIEPFDIAAGLQAVNDALARKAGD